MGLLDFSSKLVGGEQADALDDQTKREAFSQAMLQLAAGINPYGGNLLGDVARGLAGGRQVFGEAANQQAMQGMSYEDLAQYWADKDPAKAKQYADLAQSQNPKTREVFSRTEGVVNDQGETGVLLTYRNGEQEFKPVKYSPDAVKQGRAPAAPRVPVGMMWDPEQGRAVQIPGVPVRSPAGRAAGGSVVSPKERGLPPAEKAKVEAKANMFAMARNNIDKLSRIVRDSDPVQLADPRSPVGAQAASLATQIQDAYRVMADLGVINEADVPRIENVVPGATSLPTIAKGKPAALEKYRVFGEQLDQSLANIGYRRKQPAKSQQTSPATGGMPSQEQINAELARRAKLRGGI
jgi:hypothetical protein